MDVGRGGNVLLARELECEFGGEEEEAGDDKGVVVC